MRKGIALVCVSSIAYGLLPLVTVESYRLGFNVASASFWRFFPIAVGLFALGKAMHVDMRIGRERLVGLCLRVGLPSGSTMFLLNAAYASMDMGFAATVHFMYPIAVVFLGALVYRERIPSLIWSSVALMALGMAVLAVGSGGLSGGGWTGVPCAALSALTYAVYLLQLDHGGYSELDPLVATMYIAGVDSALMLVLGCALGPVAAPRTVAEAAVALGLSGVSLLALFCLTLGSRYLASHYVAVFGLLEPITSLTVGVLAAGEPLNAAKAVGAGLVVFAIARVAAGGRGRGEREAREEAPRPGGSRLPAPGVPRRGAHRFRAGRRS